MEAAAAAATTAAGAAAAASVAAARVALPRVAGRWQGGAQRPLRSTPPLRFCRLVQPTGRAFVSFNASGAQEASDSAPAAVASAAAAAAAAEQPQLLTCRRCKQRFNPKENHPRACKYHPGHYGGETKRKFESVHTGGTMQTVGGGAISAYWHCCGDPDEASSGCEAAPHASFDD